ncbi:hypothetical protein HDU85_006750 [Gaertneriomyces sp. JEL0708]|nr:hypothetical protein HDU85_006750 [Gaertneriomyces sp. JEL0708]
MSSIPPPPPPPATASTSTSSPASQSGQNHSQPQTSPVDLSSMIQSKIAQLQNESTIEEDEEKQIAKAIRKATKEISHLIDSSNTGTNTSVDGRLDLLRAKYLDLFQDNKRLERDFARLKRRLEVANKDKDLAKSEHSKLSTQTNKLSTLCRELQKENKRIKEESKRLAVTEQQKREELSAKFESTIWEIKNRMEEEGHEKRRRVEDSQVLKSKFKSFLEQYTLRERHYHSILKSRDLEIQLLEAKLQSCQSSIALVGAENAALKEQVSRARTVETELRGQLGIYVEKFRQVEETLEKSHDLFGGFRREMEQMTKKSKRLERDNASYKLKCDTMNKNLLEMAEERAKMQGALEQANQAKQKLEGLCRALQEERRTEREKRKSESQPPSDSGASDEQASHEDVLEEEDDELEASPSGSLPQSSHTEDPDGQKLLNDLKGVPRNVTGGHSTPRCACERGATG